MTDMPAPEPDAPLTKTRLMVTIADARHLGLPDLAAWPLVATRIMVVVVVVVGVVFGRLGLARG